MAIDQWLQAQEMQQVSWTCGYCGLGVGGNKGYYKAPMHAQTRQVQALHKTDIGPNVPRIVICPHCDKPTYFEGTTQMPGVAFGAEVGHLPASVAGLYKEARNCMSVSAFTASVLTTRKLLMNVAVAQARRQMARFRVTSTILHQMGMYPRTGFAPRKT